ncbi:MAG: UDP-N-acetylmuramoyl-L-alanyl-D-glutamate--2,6-diaminopimelate ligase [Methylococcaceae bacterium]|nr:UDP-N-acetylmuramoyl-L-alanyl-D-glutamate--2,6-diaminopimelate ligase [Methylococcaceae bacterium]
MRLTELLEGLVPLSEIERDSANKIEISGLGLDSRTIKKNEVFIALSGAKQHGLAFVDDVINRGASAVLYDTAGEGNVLSEKIKNIDIFPVTRLGWALGALAAKYYNQPSQELDVIGITGTNGKTSCSQFLGQMLDDCGIIGTLGWGEWGRLIKTANTTPDALTVHHVLYEFVKQGKKSVVMEVSSHGLDQGRVNGVHFRGAVYTNISRDHLDYHGTMEDYLAAKLKLMQAQGLKFVVLNLDDASCDRIIAAVSDSVVLWGVSAQGKQLVSGETVKAQGINYAFNGIEFDIEWRDEKQKIFAPLFGDFNVENLLCVIATLLATDYPLAEIAAKLTTLKPVVGRMEHCVTANKKLSVFVDFAHTPDALNRVLTSLRKHCHRELWVVFGCGGNRDAGKRAEMGAIAEQWADHVIVTDDNPRFEDHVAIAKQILAGCRSDKVSLVQDRQLAIEQAIARAAENDCIVIAGKGHESYQEINGIQYPFSDKEIAEQALYNRFGM